MGTNDPEYQRRYKQKHYAANKQRYIDQAVARRRKLKEEVRRIKDVPCMDCGVKYPHYVMEFDHRNPSEKKYEISKLISGYQVSKLMEEISKCDIVCANCHRARTFSRVCS